MKITLSIVCFAVILAMASAVSPDSANFIPKAFYTLDSEGHKSDLHPVSPHTAHYLRRLRRQTVSSSSSSSSSVSSSDGGPAYFTSQQVVQHTPDAGAALGIASRFGGSSGSGGTTGHIVQTTGVIDQTGRVHYKTEEGHF